MMTEIPFTSLVREATITVGNETVYVSKHAGRFVTYYERTSYHREDGKEVLFVSAKAFDSLEEAVVAAVKMAAEAESFINQTIDAYTAELAPVETLNEAQA